jgi:glycine/D-amino acid oxidase-like deaminating enzyme
MTAVGPPPGLDRPTRDSQVEAQHRSLWLREALTDGPKLPSMVENERADVAIIGGGFVGLWTAIRIKQRDPGCDVVVLEQDICGGGASGRNGGMVLSWWSKIAGLATACGEEEALRLARASDAAVDEVGSFCDEHAVECHYVRRGWLWTATAPAQLDAWESVVNLSERLGDHPFERVSPADVARRTGSPVHLAGVFAPQAATVQPAALARGLRRVALELGTRIFEGTRVVDFTRERPLTIRTAGGGALSAEKLVVATNAWAAALPELRRSIVVVSSDIAATAPIPDRLREIGWTGGESITDSQLMVNYYRTTHDGRIAFGKGTGGLGYGGRIGPDFDRSQARSQMVIGELRRSYPALADVPVEYDWGGPIDRTPTSVPILGRLGGREHILYGVGWSGNGVGPSLVGSRILSSLALGIADEWSTSALVDRRHERFPPEPLRYFGGRIVRRAVIGKEAAERAGRRPRWLAVEAAKLAPSGLEDKH